MTFKDHFSGHAALYRDARPTYPPALFALLAQQTAAHDLCWDVGCGNGQASVALADHYAAVFASDPSAEQIASATAHPRVHYAVEPAEACSLPARSVDLVCIAQALHWFDHATFYAEVRRVLKPGGLIAAIGYARTRVGAEVDAVYRRLYEDITADYWPPERALIDERYASLPFPFDAIDPGPLPAMRQQWNLHQYLAYLESWSAVARYRSRHGHSPLDLVRDDFAHAWGEPDHTRNVEWEMFVLAGR